MQFFVSVFLVKCKFYISDLVFKYSFLFDFFFNQKCYLFCAIVLLTICVAKIQADEKPSNVESSVKTKRALHVYSSPYVVHHASPVVVHHAAAYHAPIVHHTAYHAAYHAPIVHTAPIVHAAPIIHAAPIVSHAPLVVHHFKRR